MRPLELNQLGLSGALRQLALEFAARSGLSTSFIGGAEAPVLAEDAAVALFRIAQESLTNVERHARANQVRLELSSRAGEVRLELEDDGGGFDVVRVMRDPACGIGLRNMRERVEHLRGHFHIQSAPGRTTLQVRLPTAARSSSP
jgi:two-component system, NarL family, sensor kinase